MARGAAITEWKGNPMPANPISATVKRAELIRSLAKCHDPRTVRAERNHYVETLRRIAGIELRHRKSDEPNEADTVITLRKIAMAGCRTASIKYSMMLGVIARNKEEALSDASIPSGEQV
jgi:hypothetical protein